MRSWRSRSASDRRRPAPSHEPGADRPVARAELLPPLVARPAARHRRGPCEAQHHRGRAGGSRVWRATASGSASFGQQIIEWLGGKRIHPAWIVPGGVDAPLTAETRDRILSTIPEAIAAIERALAWFKSTLLRWADEAATFGDFPSAFMGLVDQGGNVDYYDGSLRVMDADGRLLADNIDPREYQDYLGEAVEPWSYLKSTYYKVLGYPDGIYRVGPLARLIVAAQMGTPARRSRARRVPATSRTCPHELVPLPLRAPHRHALRRRADRRDPARAARSSRPAFAPSRRSIATRASACPRRRAAR